MALSELVILRRMAICCAFVLSVAAWPSDMVRSSSCLFDGGLGKLSGFDYSSLFYFYIIYCLHLSCNGPLIYEQLVNSSICATKCKNRYLV